MSNRSGTVDHADAAISSAEARVLVQRDTVGFEVRERRGAQPLWGRRVLGVYLIGFAEGAGSHIADLVRGGIHAYALFPPVSLQVFFVSLVILDPLAAVLVLDVSAHWWGNRHWLRDEPAQLLWLLPITVFGVFVVAFTVPLHRAVAGAADSLRRPCRQAEAHVQPLLPASGPQGRFLLTSATSASTRPSALCDALAVGQPTENMSVGGFAASLRAALQLIAEQPVRRHGRSVR